MKVCYKECKERNDKRKKERKKERKWKDAIRNIRKENKESLKTKTNIRFELSFAKDKTKWAFDNKVFSAFLTDIKGQEPRDDVGGILSLPANEARPCMFVANVFFN